MTRIYKGNMCDDENVISFQVGRDKLKIGTERDKRPAGTSCT